MASIVYYGVSQTAAATQVKQVILEDANFNPNNLIKGDILNVYFSQRNEVDNPTLVLNIGDPEQEHNNSNAGGDLTYNTGVIPVLAGAWADGEVVSFCYTYNGSVVENADQVTYWEMVGKPVATNETHGDVKIAHPTEEKDYEDDAAASVGVVKELIGDVTIGKLTYESTYETVAGTLSLAQYEPGDTSYENPIEGTLTSVQVTVPTVPPNVGAFDNDVGYITNPINGTLDFITNTDEPKNPDQQITADGNIIIDLKEDETNNLVINGLNDIVLNPEGQVIIGSQDDNDNLTVYGNIYANNLDASGITVDTIGAHNTTNNLITFTSPTNLEDTVTMNGGIYIGNQTLEDYITSLFDSGDNVDAIGAATAGLFHDYLKTQRYYSRSFSIQQGVIRYIAFASEPPANMSDTSVSVVVYQREGSRNLNIDGYDIVGIITWETWMGNEEAQSTISTPKNANIYGIWWKNNDPTTGNLYLKATALDANAEHIHVSVDILYKKKTYAITYDLDGGVNGPSTQYKFYNHSIKISKKIPTKTGYTFGGWSTTGEGVAARRFFPGNTYDLNSSITLKAIWT